MKDQQYEKQYKADKFKMEPVIDKKGEQDQKDIQGFLAKKYLVKTTFTMTKLKLNVSEDDSISKFETFEEYIASDDLVLQNNDS